MSGILVMVGMPVTPAVSGVSPVPGEMGDNTDYIVASKIRFQ